jgi:hypothetical protein
VRFGHYRKRKPGLSICRDGVDGYREKAAFGFRDYVILGYL